MGARFVCVVLGFVVLSLGCESGAHVGATCSRASECAGSLVCRFGSCRTECVANRDCPTGAACLLVDQVGVCGVASDLGCETGVGRECPTGLSCVVDQCERACDDATDCPSDGRCTSLGDGRSFCSISTVTDDSGVPPPDAGAADASASQVDSGALPSSIDVEDLCLGANGACALGDDGRVYCWGSSVAGRLGDGGDCTAAPNRLATPQVVMDGAAPLTNVDAIACADRSTCAHLTTGHVVCWGANDLGQLGRDTTGACDASPGRVLRFTDELDLVIPSRPSFSAAGEHTCAIDSETHQILCWGRNDLLFDVTMPDDTAYPRAIDLGPATNLVPAAGIRPTTIGVAGTGACVRTDDAAVRCWGANEHGQIAVAMLTPRTLASTVVIGRPTSIIAGAAHRCSLTLESTVACWGGDQLGQLGGVSTMTCGSDRCSPSATDPSASLARYSDLAASGTGDTTCGVVAMRSGAGEVECWGANEDGQAGQPLGSPIAPLAPRVQRTGGAGPLVSATRVHLGPRTACAVDLFGEVFCWGDTDFDPATPGVPEAVRVPIGPS